jgi:hypothetical protein
MQLTEWKEDSGGREPRDDFGCWGICELFDTLASGTIAKSPELEAGRCREEC